MDSQVRAWIAAALDGSGNTPGEIWQGIQSGIFHLFMHSEGCMVGEFIESPRCKTLHIFAAGGTLKAMDELGPTVETFARLNQCTQTAATGRKGWLRYARKHGYQPADPVIWKGI